MAKEPLPALFSLWMKKEADAEHVIGQMLQHLVEWEKWRKQVEDQLKVNSRESTEDE